METSISLEDMDNLVPINLGAIIEWKPIIRAISVASTATVPINLGAIIEWKLYA